MSGVVCEDEPVAEWWQDGEFVGYDDLLRRYYRDGASDQSKLEATLEHLAAAVMREYRPDKMMSLSLRRAIEMAEERLRYLGRIE